MNPARALNIADLKKLARKRLPRILFDWVEGGTEDELLLRRNEGQFARFRLIPSYLTNVEKIDPTIELFGRISRLPFGIGPTGHAGLLRPGADLMLANAAGKSGIPFVLSGNSTTSIEKVCAEVNGDVWFQLYAARAADVSDDLLRRAKDAGVKALVYTIDAPGDAKRERDLRNGFDLPLRITPRLIADVLTHPRWLAAYLSGGGFPVMENWAPYAPAASAIAVAKVMKDNFFATQTWSDFERIRSRWQGPFVVKGVTDPRDAETASRLGAEGIIISNHGGRQLDAAPTALEILPHIRAAVPKKVTIIVDGGFRRGSDIVIALCLGADFVLTGRATLYGAIAGGDLGAERAVTILGDEVLRIMSQIGCCTVAQLDRTRIMAVNSAGDLWPVGDVSGGTYLVSDNRAKVVGARVHD